jgi:hypothetical protein
MVGAQPSCIEPTLIAIQLSFLWITKKALKGHIFMLDDVQEA